MSKEPKHIKTFYGFPEGPDTDFGVSRNESIKVTIEQSWPWCDEQTKEAKEALSEYFDTKIISEEEYIQEAKDLDAYVKSMLES